MKKKNAFTLIEIIAVLVILAVISLIVTPLVMNIVKKSKISADKRSVDGYGKAIETAISEYLLDTGKNPKSIDDLDIKYTGNEVNCGTRTLNSDRSIFLTECSVKGRKVKDNTTDDGYYHYGKQTIFNYEQYQIGDEITYNGMNFYVIANSDANQDYVTLLKAEPLTVDEVNTYGIDANGVNHVNRYTSSSKGTAYDLNGYGRIVYYSSATCGTLDGTYDTSGCASESATSYDTSDIKYVVDNWTNDKIKSTDLKEDSLGYKSRLISYEDLTNNLGYVRTSNYEATYLYSSNPFSWMHAYSYWTMSQMDDYDMIVWSVGSSYVNGKASVPPYSSGYITQFASVRPVINIKKIALR